MIPLNIAFNIFCCVIIPTGTSFSMTINELSAEDSILIQEHGLGEYLQQRIKLINTSMDSLFVSEQTSLTDFM